MKKRNQVLILIFLVCILIIVNYNFLDNKIEGFLIGERIEYAKVTRIVDGDTIKINNNDTIRFLGINTPERGEKYYKEAKEFLEKEILNKTIKIERTEDNRDKYQRLLRYVFLDGKNINVEIVKNGLANYYFYSGKDIYSDELEDAWEECLKKEINLCEKSKNKCAGCIEIKDENLILYNSCSFSCSLKDWTIKGEGREKFVFNQSILIAGGKTEFKLDLTNSGGSLFLRDEEGKLVVWESY
ncbi:MAG: thermonuclease family protein [Nanoarchaeota archaeon]|nr:thermonuclease family protein [Nanoarchaeota archaeon]